MGNLESYNTVLTLLKERKKFERESSKKIDNRKCSVCKNNLVKNGISQYSGVCRNCVSSSLK